MKMRLEEAIVFVLVRAGRGMTISNLTDIINRESLHIQADGRAVTQEQVYATICRNRGVFCKLNGLISLYM